jgi:histidine triad (HIT) family protein
MMVGIRSGIAGLLAEYATGAMRGGGCGRRLAAWAAHPIHPIIPATAMADKTIFSRIIDGEIPGKFVYQDEHCVAIRDINPAAPVHVLVIPRKPIPSIADLTPEDHALAGHLLMVVKKVAEQEGVAESGYRVVINVGDEGGQTVPHLHVHILGGKQLHGHGTA